MVHQEKIKGIFMLGWLQHLQKILGATAGAGLGSGRRDPLEAALPLKNVFLLPQLRPASYVLHGCSSRNAMLLLQTDALGPKTNAFKEKEEGFGVTGISS